jgi:hypothetical protein
MGLQSTRFLLTNETVISNSACPDEDPLDSRTLYFLNNFTSQVYILWRYCNNRRILVYLKTLINYKENVLSDNRVVVNQLETSCLAYIN